MLILYVHKVTSLVTNIVHLLCVVPVLILLVRVVASLFTNIGLVDFILLQ